MKETRIVALVVFHLVSEGKVLESQTSDFIENGFDEEGGLRELKLSIALYSINLNQKEDRGRWIVHQVAWKVIS